MHLLSCLNQSLVLLQCFDEQVRYRYYGEDSALKGECSLILVSQGHIQYHMYDTDLL